VEGYPLHLGFYGAHELHSSSDDERKLKSLDRAVDRVFYRCDDTSSTLIIPSGVGFEGKSPAARINRRSNCLEESRPPRNKGGLEKHVLFHSNASIGQ
jgi:hypothetical protein